MNVLFEVVDGQITYDIDEGQYSIDIKQSVPLRNEYEKGEYDYNGQIRPKTSRSITA